MVRLQIKMGSKGIWWGGNAARAIRSYMEARYSFVQQVRPSFRHCENYVTISSQLMDLTLEKVTRIRDCLELLGKLPRVISPILEFS